GPVRQEGVAQAPDPGAGVEDDPGRPAAHLDAARVPSHRCGVRPRRRDAAANTPKLDSHVPSSLAPPGVPPTGRTLPLPRTAPRPSSRERAEPPRPTHGTAPESSSPAAPAAPKRIGRARPSGGASESCGGVDPAPGRGLASAPLRVGYPG